MTPSPSLLIALPVFNEKKHVGEVLDQVVRQPGDVLVVDDGSTDGTSELLAQRHDILLQTHATNRGYGAALRTAFDYALQQGYDVLVTIDCDGQHEPQRITQLADVCYRDPSVDIVSGSRYLDDTPTNGQPAPADRRHINHTITRELNERLDLQLTDAFCGFKAYRVSSLARLHLTETGYAMPLELWVQATHAKLQIEEMAVPRIYLDEQRSFGGALDDARKRLVHYREVIDRACQALAGTATCRPHRQQATVGCGLRDARTVEDAPVDGDPC